MATKKKSISDQIREALINQKDLAELIEVSNATFTRKMQNNDFSPKEIKAIQTALRVMLYQ